jgi:hypothetical protein
MRPTRSSRALEAIVRDLIDTRGGATYFAERVWAVSLRYELGGHHPLVGCSVPDFEMADDRRWVNSSGANWDCFSTSTRSVPCDKARAAGAGESPTLREAPRIGWSDGCAGSAGWLRCLGHRHAS